jgi:hypothetical protein
MNDATQGKVIPLLQCLPGDLVHVSGLGGSHACEGVVDVTAPHLNILWIHTSNGDRKLVDASQCKIQRIDYEPPLEPPSSSPPR